jgi:hypothetical protein
MWNVSDKIDLIFEQTDDESKLNPLLKLSAFSDPQGSKAIEKDLVNLRQSTKDSLKDFIKGKGGVDNLLKSSKDLSKLSTEIYNSVKNVAHQHGIDYQISSTEAKKLNKLVNKLKRLPPDKQEELLGIDDDIEHKIKSEKENRKLIHVGTYPLTGKSKLRIAVEGDSINKHRLYVFKRGSKYIGYLVINNKREVKESFEEKISLILEAVDNKTILKHTSSDIKDLFNLQNYEEEADIAYDRLQEYSDKIELVAPHLATQLKMKSINLDDLRDYKNKKETEEKFDGYHIEELDDNKISSEKLNDFVSHFDELSKKAENEYERSLYDDLSQTLSRITTSNEINKLIDNMKNSIRRYKSLKIYKSPRYQRRIDIISKVVDSLEEISN